MYIMQFFSFVIFISLIYITNVESIILMVSDASYLIFIIIIVLVSHVINYFILYLSIFYSFILLYYLL